MTPEHCERPKLRTANEVAGILNCDAKTVYRMLDAGRLQGIYLMGPPQPQRRGKKGVRIFESSVDALLASGPAEIAEFQRNLRPQKSGAGVPPLHRTTRPTKPKATGRAWEALPPPA